MEVSNTALEVLRGLQNDLLARVDNGYETSWHWRFRSGCVDADAVRELGDAGYITDDNGNNTLWCITLAGEQALKAWGAEHEM